MTETDNLLLLALKPFAEAADDYDTIPGLRSTAGDVEVHQQRDRRGYHLTVDQLRFARAVYHEHFGAGTAKIDFDKLALQVAQDIDRLAWGNHESQRIARSQVIIHCAIRDVALTAAICGVDAFAKKVPASTSEQAP